MIPDRNQIIMFIEKCIKERQAWANSPEGYKMLGPGSPVVPGMHEYYRILRYVKDGDEREVDR